MSAGAGTRLALDRAFPQNDNLLVIVIDGATADLADRAARRLAERLRAEPELFRYVRQPDGGAFFERNGLLFLPVDELQAMSDQLIAAQPLIGSLARDPSLRGLFDTLTLFVERRGNGRSRDRPAQPDPDGDRRRRTRRRWPAAAQPLSWQQLMTGRAAGSARAAPVRPGPAGARFHRARAAAPGRAAKSAGWPASWRSTRSTGCGCA